MNVVSLKNAKNIYDIMAMCSVDLLDEININGYNLWDYEDKNYTYIHDMIEIFLKSIKKEGYLYALNSLIKEIEKIISIKGCTPDILWAIISNIDSLVTEKIEVNKMFKVAGIYEYKSLNTCITEEIKIIPRINESLMIKDGEYILRDPRNKEHTLFRKKTECPCSKIDIATINYMVWDKEKISRYPMSIYRVEDGSQIAKHFNDRRKLNIAIVPLSSKDLEDILDIKYKKRTFHINGMKLSSQSEIKDRYLEAYQKCINKDIDFLIYPEMLMTEDIIDSLNYEMISDKKGPTFIINGSIWEKRTNRSIITDGFGNYIFEYYKKCGFNYQKDSKEYKEDLDNSLNKEYFILEIDKIGRIGVCICKDIRDPEVAMFHQYIDTDILLVPAFSNSLVLVSNARNMAENFNCITVFANSCAACTKKWNDNKPHDIGFITMPAKENTENSCYTEKYGADECYKKCDEQCNIKIFTLIFDEYKYYNDKISIMLETTSV